MGFSAHDALIAATLCPGLTADRWVAGLTERVQATAPQGGLFADALGEGVAAVNENRDVSTQCQAEFFQFDP